jgi:hypothetical protein
MSFTVIFIKKYKYARKYFELFVLSEYPACIFPPCLLTFDTNYQAFGNPQKPGAWLTVFVNSFLLFSGYSYNSNKHKTNLHSALLTNRSKNGSRFSFSRSLAQKSCIVFSFYIFNLQFLFVLKTI